MTESPISERVADLVRFIDASPTPYHATAEAVRRLEAAGYREAEETALWDLSPGDRRYVTRNEGSLVALEVGAASPADAGSASLERIRTRRTCG